MVRYRASYEHIVSGQLLNSGASYMPSVLYINKDTNAPINCTKPSKIVRFRTSFGVQVFVFSCVQVFENVINT